jgi:flagellar FliL protein
LQVEDAKTAEAMKVYMPSIRNGILMLVSQRTSESMLQMEGKEKLSTDILREVSQVMGFPVPASDKVDTENSDKPAKKKRVPSPLQAVLFSSFIVQ